MSAVQIPQSTARTVMLKLFTAGTTTAATGKTLAVVLSKAGAAFANPNAGATNATEVASGWYKVTIDTTDTATLGDLVVRGTATGCDDSERLFAVVLATTGGLTNLDATVSSRTKPADTQAAVTNLTNAPTAGDFTAAMKTSLNAATPASVSGDVGGKVLGGGSGTITAIGCWGADGTGHSWTYTAPANPSTVVLDASQPNYTPARAGDAMTLTSAYDFAKGTVAASEGYAADGSAATPAQLLYMIYSAVQEFSITGTTISLKKLDGTTVWGSVTLDSSTAPTSRTRTS